MYGMVFSRMSTNKKEAGTSDETDDDDDDIEEAVPQARIIDNMHNSNPSIQNR